MEDALNTHAQYVTNPSRWPYEQMTAYSGVNAALFELAHNWNGDSDYLAAINRWGRPIKKTRIMGYVTLTHARGTYPFTIIS